MRAVFYYHYVTHRYYARHNTAKNTGNYITHRYYARHNTVNFIGLGDI